MAALRVAKISTLSGIRIAALWIGVLASPAIKAGEALDPVRAAAQINEDTTECRAYLTNLQICAQDQNLEDKFKEKIRFLDEASYKFGRMAGMSENAMLARFKLTLKRMGNDMEYNCANIPVLIEKHSEKCILILSDFEKYYFSLRNK